MNDKKRYYSIIPAEVKYNKKLKPISRLLYAEIASLTNDKGYCWASNAYFAELYSVSKSTISRCISELKENGYIKIDYERKNTNIEKRKIFINSISDRVSSKLTRGYSQNNQAGIVKKVKDNNKFNIKKNKESHSEFDLFVNELSKVFYRLTLNKADRLSKIHCFKTKDKQEELINIFNNRRFCWKDSIKYAEIRVKDKNNISALWLDFISYLKVYLINGDKEKLIKRHYTKDELLKREKRLKEIENMKLKKEREEQKMLLEEEKNLGIDNMTEDEIIEFTKNRFKHLKRC
ncbi:helix-turn-helix domain-containing protein [Brachyspira alvinipulli]|uniref:helix-turn-helix domain-containing protein n=1 Tax=Brachyspira alvinipulli TaxID=84379 RepID=UPI0030042229